MKNIVENVQEDQYSKLMWMAVLSMICMYFLMYTIMDELDETLANENALMIAAILTLPSIIVEVIMLGGIRRDLKINLAMFLLSVIAFLSFYQMLNDGHLAVVNS